MAKNKCVSCRREMDPRYISETQFGWLCNSWRACLEAKTGYRFRPRVPTNQHRPARKFSV